jgi:hypothetical protein
MGKAEGQRHYAAEIHRSRTGFSALGTANVLDNLDHNFRDLLRADDVNGLADVEVEHIKKARAEVRMAAKRLHIIARRCK